MSDEIKNRRDQEDDDIFSQLDPNMRKQISDVDDDDFGSDDDFPSLNSRGNAPVPPGFSDDDQDFGPRDTSSEFDDLDETGRSRNQSDDDQDEYGGRDVSGEYDENDHDNAFGNDSEVDHEDQDSDHGDDMPESNPDTEAAKKKRANMIFYGVSAIALLGVVGLGAYSFAPMLFGGSPSPQRTQSAPAAVVAPVGGQITSVPSVQTPQSTSPGNLPALPGLPSIPSPATDGPDRPMPTDTATPSEIPAPTPPQPVLGVPTPTEPTAVTENNLPLPTPPGMASTQSDLPGSITPPPAFPVITTVTPPAPVQMPSSMPNPVSQQPVIPMPVVIQSGGNDPVQATPSIDMDAVKSMVETVVRSVTLEAVSSAITPMVDRLDGVDGAVSDVRQSMRGVENTLISLSTRVDGNVDDVRRLSERIAAMEGRIEVYESMVGRMSAQPQQPQLASSPQVRPTQPEYRISDETSGSPSITPPPNRYPSAHGGRGWYGTEMADNSSGSISAAPDAEEYAADIPIIETVKIGGVSRGVVILRMETGDFIPVRVGTVVPGIGTVKEIYRDNGSWGVITTEGRIVS